MSNLAIMASCLGVALVSMGLMVWRDFRNMKKALRDDETVSKFIQDLDSHDPTPYEEFIDFDE